KPPLMDPTEVPTIRSASMPRSYRARTIPTWTAPRLAPPERTNAVFGLMTHLRLRSWSFLPEPMSAGRVRTRRRRTQTGHERQTEDLRHRRRRPGRCPCGRDPAQRGVRRPPDPDRG